MIVAPILAIIAYFAVDYMVAEKPHKAVSGASYELIAKPNCRYTSGLCSLVNGDFEIDLTAEYKNSNKIKINLKSRFPLETASIAIVNPPENEPRPTAMQLLDELKKNWTVILQIPKSAASRLRLVVSSQQVKYYTETSMEFTRVDSVLPNFEELKDGN